MKATQEFDSLRLCYLDVWNKFCKFSKIYFQILLNQTLSLAITTHNRPKMTIKSFEKVLDDPRISEIVIVDDHSDIEQYYGLQESIARLKNDKIKVYRNSTNVGMSLNKLKAISYCNNDWVIIFDSDNVLDANYLDAFEKVSDLLYPHYIFCPSAALPKFVYEKISKFSMTKSVIQHLLKGEFATITEWMLNTCNYIVHRVTYLQTYQYNIDMKATDTIWHNYNHLKQGGSLYVVPQMTYQHLVHDDSGWRQDRKYNKQKAIEVRKLIEQL